MFHERKLEIDRAAERAREQPREGIDASPAPKQRISDLELFQKIKGCRYTPPAAKRADVIT